RVGAGGFRDRVRRGRGLSALRPRGLGVGERRTAARARRSALRGISGIRGIPPIDRACPASHGPRRPASAIARRIDWLTAYTKRARALLARTRGLLSPTVKEYRK